MPVWQPNHEDRNPTLEAEELKRLRKENERLQRRLQQAEAIIEAQKKLSQLLGLNPMEEEDSETQ